MKLTTLKIQGFRCYGPAPVTVRFGDLTAFVGGNGSGKTAALVALHRMFGTTHVHRTLTREDFHLAPGVADPDELALEIEARLEFPELLDDAAAQTSPAVPECLRHILAQAGEATPLCRIRLRAIWRKTASAEGDIEQKLEWIDSMDDVPSEGSVHSLSSWERSLIQVFYVPASRDAGRELRFASGTILGRALDKVEWSQATRDRVVELTQDLADGLRAESGFVRFEEHLKTHWGALRGGRLGSPELSLAEADLATVLRRLDARLVGDTSSLPISLLSEGERSLMYFALVAASLEFEAEALAAAGATPTMSSPVLTILAVEEPENHLAPYFLSRILKLLHKVPNAQVALTSHSASILRRVRPEEVRHFRVGVAGEHVISEIVLPASEDESLKYVREAVQAHPELYFASVVVLGEGASEEVVLPRIARALDVDVDPQFIAVVPLGGRHVHHFWRLLRALGTPHLTLVDLDMERHEGGWKRLHGLAHNLIEAGESRDDVRGTLSSSNLDEMRNWAPAAIDDVRLQAFLKHLEDRFAVYLSAPLDLDLACLAAYSGAYQALVPAGQGPRVPSDAIKKKGYLTAATQTVLGDEKETVEAIEGQPAVIRGATYDSASQLLFPLYRYLFLSGSKPVSHARAFATLEDPAIAAACPAVLRRLILRAKDLAETHHA